MQFVYDFDNQMNKIQMVTKSTNEETKALAVTYANIAEQLSSTTMDVARNAEEWLRQGRTIAETNQLIKTSMIFSKVGFLDSAEAASLLTASINGYKLSVQDAMSVVDKMSAIDVAAATSTADLATALSYTATSAKLAGLELDEVLSYIAVVSDVTQQSAETIGNSFKTIFARMQQVKLGALVDEEGEDISNTSKVLESYGIQLADMTTGTFRDLGDVLGELAEKWETLTNMQKSEISSTIAGKQPDA
jgi:TP901 family phage tail tape measure protein